MLHSVKQRAPGQIDVAPVEPGRHGAKEYSLPPLARSPVEVLTTYEEPADLVRARPITPITGHTVLVVDDHDFTREAVARSLTFDGHTVFVATNGQQALTLLRRHSF